MTSIHRAEPKSRRRSSSFGHVEGTAKGWRSRYTDPSGRRRSKSFHAKADARAWLSAEHAAILRRQWKAPELTGKTVGAYFDEYVGRPALRESTKALYQSLWRNHLEAGWAGVRIADVTPATVRAWHRQASKSTKPRALSQSYALLHGTLGQAVDDEVLAINPARIKGAGTPQVAHQGKALTVGEVMAISAEILPRYRTLILVLAFGGLRFGEAAALQRKHVSDAKLKVERSVRAGVVGRPKTDAGIRTVSVPAFVAQALVSHLEAFVAPGPEALVFATSGGRFVAGQNFSQTMRRAAHRAGVEGHLRTHELRHTGATLAAASGATMADLMARLGHSSPRAALIYQHAVADRDDAIARALDGLVMGYAAAKSGE